MLPLINDTGRLPVSSPEPSWLDVVVVAAADVSVIVAVVALVSVDSLARLLDDIERRELDNNFSCRCSSSVRRVAPFVPKIGTFGWPSLAITEFPIDLGSMIGFCSLLLLFASRVEQTKGDEILLSERQLDNREPP